MGAEILNDLCCAMDSTELWCCLSGKGVFALQDLVLRDMGESFKFSQFSNWEPASAETLTVLQTRFARY